MHTNCHIFSSTLTIHSSITTATASDQEKQNFFRHIQQAKRIGRSPHPHLVSMVGCVTLQQPACLVLELPEKGSLLAHLEKCRKQVGWLSETGMYTVSVRDFYIYVWV